MNLLLLAQNATPMVEKLRFLHPEIILFVATVAVMILGASPVRARRQACAGLTIAALVMAGVLAIFTPAMPGAPLPGLINFAKPLIAAAAILFVLLMTGSVDQDAEAAADRGAPFNPLRSNRAEFFAFFLFSITGLMLTTSADDLIWLFLALELTSLPTYVMVSISTPRARSQEAGVKYFFLGAFGAAIFLYGFTLIYGATGTTTLFAPAGEPSVTASLAAQAASPDGLSTIAILGLVLAIVGVAFKIAAVPMHFYTPDVYQGASTPVAAFLAFVPKTAGFVALILILSAVGWTHGNTGVGSDIGTSLPEPIRVTLWVIAALTMTVGNVLAWLQTSVKRLLAYSSIAHSGYMLVGLIAGPGTAGGGGPATNGIAAVLFYLLCYAFMNVGAFAVLACLERQRSGQGQVEGQVGGADEEVENIDDLKGLCTTHPRLGWTMVLCAGSLLGLPPLLGFFGKLFLFTSAISAGEITLVVVLGINSAVAAFYYLRLIALPLLEDPTDHTRALKTTPFTPRIAAAILSAASVIALVPATSYLMSRANDAVRGDTAAPSAESNPDPAALAQDEPTPTQITNR